MISLEKWYILTPTQKLSKNVRDLGKLIVPKGLKSCPKSNKSPNLVTLVAVAVAYLRIQRGWMRQLGRKVAGSGGAERKWHITNDTVWPDGSIHKFGQKQQKIIHHVPRSM